MLYAIISQDVENSLDKRLSVRPAHVERLQELKEQGRLILAGPHPAIDNIDPGPAGFTGSLIIAEFEALEDAQAWADADPRSQLRQIQRPRPCQCCVRHAWGRPTQRPHPESAAGRSPPESLPPPAPFQSR